MNSYLNLLRAFAKNDIIQEYKTTAVLREDGSVLVTTAQNEYVVESNAERIQDEPVIGIIEGCLHYKRGKQFDSYERWVVSNSFYSQIITRMRGIKSSISVTYLGFGVLCVHVGDVDCYYDIDNNLLYVEGYGEMHNVVSVLKTIVSNGASDEEICVIPLMCYVSGHKDVWAMVKEFYEDENYDRIMSIMLQYHSECVESASKFHRSMADDKSKMVLSSLKQLCDTTDKATYASIGGYTVYKALGECLITTDVSVLFHTFTDFDDFQSKLDSCSEEIIGNDTERVIAVVAKYLNSNKVRSTAGILREVDRFLKLAGQESGLVPILDVAEDIGLINK